jgi:F-type H+-transporting ATPase subunit b
VLLLKTSIITINPGLMIWTLVTFAIVLFILRRYAFKPLQQTIEARRQAVTQQIEQAERDRAEAHRLVDEYRQQLAQAQRDATRILEDARRTAEERERQAVQALEEEKDRLMARARQEIESETRRSLSQIKEQIADLTIFATEKVIRARLDEQEQRRLIDDALSGVDFSGFGLPTEEARGVEDVRGGAGD